MDVLLYHHPGSLCSQKVRLALAEKGVEYRAQVVDIGPRGENFEPWYARINPRMVVPTLVHDGVVVCDSARIVRYIDGHFEGPALSASTEEGKRLEERWIARADRLPLREISYGTLRGPFGYVLRHSDRIRLRKLERMERANPELAGLYRARIEDVRQWFERSRDPREVSAMLAELNEALDELEAHSIGRMFIADERFGLADILWTVVLARVDGLGLGAHTDRRPRVREYITRMMKRPSIERAQVWNRVPWRVIGQTLLRSLLRKSS
ncbi:MAG: glutathione S-transferase family protein [Polyangiales bacterium]